MIVQIHAKLVDGLSFGISINVSFGFNFGVGKVEQHVMEFDCNGVDILTLKPSLAHEFLKETRPIQLARLAASARLAKMVDCECRNIIEELCISTDAYIVGVKLEQMPNCFDNIVGNEGPLDSAIQWHPQIVLTVPRPVSEVRNLP
jgi:hypothetical protein